MDAVDEGKPLFTGQLCRATIGKQHEFLYHALGQPPLAGQDIQHPPLLVQDKLRLRGAELQSSPAGPPGNQPPGQLPHQLDRREKGMVLLQNLLPGEIAQDGVDLLVNALDAGTDDAPLKGIGQQSAGLVQLHQAGEGEPVLHGVKGADAVGKGFGQHGNHRVGVVDGGPPLKGAPVQGALVGNIIAHIRDVDP